MSADRGTTPANPSRVWHRAAVAYWWAMLAVSVIVSAYGNVRHAEAVAPVEHLAVARWIAGALPVTLLLMVEGIAIGVRAGVAGWQRWMSTIFVAALAAVGLVIGAASPVPVQAQAKPTIKLVYTDPLSGPFAQVGDANLKQWQYVISYINATGGDPSRTNVLHCRG